MSKGPKILIPKTTQAHYSEWKTEKDIKTTKPISNAIHHADVLRNLALKSKYHGMFGEVFFRTLNIAGKRKKVAIKYYYDYAIEHFRQLADWSNITLTQGWWRTPKIYVTPARIVSVGNEVIEELTTASVPLPKIRYILHTDETGKQRIICISQSFESRQKTTLSANLRNYDASTVKELGALYAKIINLGYFPHPDMFIQIKHLDGTINFVPLDLDLLIAQKIARIRLKDTPYNSESKQTTEHHQIRVIAQIMQVIEILAEYNSPDIVEEFTKVLLTNILGSKSYDALCNLDPKLILDLMSFDLRIGASNLAITHNTLSRLLELQKLAKNIKRG